MTSDVPSHRFVCTLIDAGAIPIEFDQRAVFGRARPPVIVTIGAYSYRSTIAVMNGRSFVPFRRSHRDAAGFEAGAVIEVTLTLDLAPRTVELPDDLASAIDASDKRAAWDRLSVTRQREQAGAVAGAKRPDTRLRRIATTVAILA